MYVIAVVGPTACSKTDIAVEFARLVGGEVISLDAMQVYRFMNIGTAKPPLSVRKEVPHHLVDVKYPWEEISIAEFLRMAERSLDHIFQEGKVPIAVGGSGFYARAFLDGFSFRTPPGDPVLRSKLEEEAKENPKALWERLRKVDPVSAGKTHPNNLKRVIRALEIYYLTGRPKSSYTIGRNRRFRIFKLGVFYPRPLLYRRIERRVKKMVEEGLVGEAAFLHSLPLSRTAKEAIGYKEIFRYFEGTVPTLRDAIDLVVRNTRRFAKRQITWFRREGDILWLNLAEHGEGKAIEILCDVANLLREGSENALEEISRKYAGCVSQLLEA